MQKITPFLWFDGKAEEAAKLYTSLFPNSKINYVKYWAEGSPFPSDQVMTISFELDGQPYYGMDAGPQFKFNEAVSMMVQCADQAEIDKYWNTLTADGGQEQPCGWLKDKFGLSWQITPEGFDKWMTSKDPAKMERVFNALMKMKKIDIATLEKAAEEVPETA